MTDAREIIARHLCTMAAQGWSGISAFERAAYRTTAAGMVEAVTSAGFRIIGPDEVDQVTLERALDAATEAYANNDDWDYFNSAEVSIVDAIRAIGRKA